MKPPSAFYGSATGPTQETRSGSLSYREVAVNAAQLLLMILIPWAVFAGFSWALISVHVYMHPVLRVILVASTATMVVLMFVAALLSRGRWLRKGGRLGAEPRYLKDFTWWSAAAALSLVAFLAGLTMGDWICSSGMKSYYDITTLDSYDNVNAATTQGKQLIDAGRVVFSKGSRLDFNRSMGTKGEVTYCVAPIIASPSEALPATFDFWAAGKDCCSAGGLDFHCGAYNISTARGGIRLLDEADAVNFRLAVQEAETAHHIQSVHPLFFEWVANPIGDISAKKDDALWLYFASNLVFLVVIYVLVVIGYACFWRAKLRQ
eukprot:gb/GFBE01073808.1/.p1 GENE.gb/GFBE01073808.1/~~gb/GFBE01073808.1/.p1  ORF type:complete len:320 (+),score=69.79 gb/GFBE01073808.1/:1-960(+)